MVLGHDCLSKSPGGDGRENSEICALGGSNEQSVHVFFKNRNSAFMAVSRVLNCTKRYVQPLLMSFKPFLKVTLNGTPLSCFLE